MNPLPPIALALLSLSATAQTPPAKDEGETVAWIDVIAPKAETFVLRATIPLPKGEFAPGAREIPFGIRSHAPGDPVILAQVEGVSRYPTGEWDVVQLLARVERGPDEKAGEALRYAVVRAPHPRARAHEPGKVLSGLLKRETGLLLRARDVYGNLYTFDLLAKRGDAGFGARSVRKAGRWLNQFRVAGAMMPVTEAGDPARGGPPLPHLCGVIAWFSDYDGEAPLSLDLRIHNGLISGARAAEPGEEPLGPIYWQSLELCIPRDLKLLPQVRDPFFGAPYLDLEWVVWPIVAPYEDGKLHLMGPQMQFLRRFTLVHRGDEEAGLSRLANEGLGFCAPSTTDWSWSNPATARYFPQRDLLPSMDFFEYQGQRGNRALRLQESQRLAELAKQLRTGSGGPYPAVSPVLGWAHPYFVSIEGSKGGEEISFVEGQRALGGISVEGYSRLELLHRMNTSRQPQAMWDRRGEPVGFFEWLTPNGEGKWIPFDFQTHARATVPAFRLPCRKGPAASPQVAEVARTKRRPPYDGGTPFQADGRTPDSDAFLVAWMPHDGQHWVRYTKNAKALLWLGDDPTAEDDLHLCAELFRLYFHDGDSDHWQRAVVTLRHMQKIADRFPNQGLPIDRDHAWGIDAFCAYYSIAGNEWRARHLPWAKRVADLLLKGATPSGIIIRSTHGPLLNNPKYQGAHAFQSQFYLLAERNLVESVFRGIDRKRVAALQELLLRTVDYLFWGPVWARTKSPYSPDSAPIYRQGPRWAFAVAKNDGYQSPPFSDEKTWGKNYLPEDAFNGDIETFYGFHSLSLAADLTQATAGKGKENRYLERTLDYWLPHQDFPTLFRSLTGDTARLGVDRTGYAANFLAQLQLLGLAR